MNRSTFYLHYETIADLVNETFKLINQRFLSYFPQREEDILGNMGSREPEELVLVTREYLIPYLRFIRDNKKVYRAAFRNPSSMQVHVRYGELKQHSPTRPAWRLLSCCGSRCGSSLKVLERIFRWAWPA